MEANELCVWLSNLKTTMNFESTAYTVFKRLIHVQGLGLLVLYGPPPPEDVKANKTYFLKAIRAFQKGALYVQP